MTILSRYQGDTTIKQGRILGSNESIFKIRDAIARGLIATDTQVLKGSQRLDIIANQYYGDGRLWWIIAAASGIGWWLQAPPGTRLVIPLNMSEIEAVI
jgi:hypothetical protein